MIIIIIIVVYVLKSNEVYKLFVISVGKEEYHSLIG